MRIVRLRTDVLDAAISPIHAYLREQCFLVHRHSYLLQEVTTEGKTNVIQMRPKVCFLTNAEQHRVGVGFDPFGNTNCQRLRLLVFDVSFRVRFHTSS